ncbi:MAG: ATP-binding protein [Nitrospiria bacterium]
MEYKNVLNILVALFNLIFGVIIFIRAQKRPAHLFFSFISFGISTWALCMVYFRFTAVQEPSLIGARLLYVPPVFIVTNFLLFTYVFPNKPFRFSLKTHGSITLISCATIFLVLLPGGVIKNVTLPLPGEEEKIIFGRGYPSYFLMVLSYFCWAFYRLHQMQKKATGLGKTQIQFVLYGTLISANLGLVTNLLLPTFGFFDLNWMGPVFTLIMVSTIGYAIVRHRLMDIRSPLSKNIAYSFLLIAALSVYSGLLITKVDQILDRYLGEISGTVILALLLAIGFEPIKRFIEKTTNRIFYKKNYDPQQLLTELNRGIHSIIDLNKILNSIKNIVMAHFNLERMGIYLVDESGFEFIAKEQSGLLDPLPISSQNPIIQSLEKQRTLVYENLLGNSNKLPDDERIIHEMEIRGIGLIAPLYSEKKLIGIYLFGHKKSGDYFTGLDLQIIEIITAQTGTTIENARLYQMVNTQMEELKENQMQQLIQAAKLTSIGELATSVAHEINNPLTGILGFATLLLKGMDDRDPKKRDVRVIESEALRTRTIVRSLLDFARQREPKREKADLNEVLKGTLVLVRHQAELSNVELIEQYKDKIPLTSIDIDQMKQVFINIIKNAFDAMPNGGKLYIKTNLLFVKKALDDRPEEAHPRDASQSIEITFSDTGTGMSPEVMKRIFEPFYTTKGDKMGTGLGLPVSYGIIERHGGQIEVQSTSGKGTTFKIKCPVFFDEV